MALPFLPAREIRIMATHIFSQAGGLKSKIRKLKSYIFRYWVGIVTPEKLSLFEFQHMTNNIAESYHARLKAIIRTHHPRIWTFMAHINDVISDTDVELRGIDGGLPLQRKRKKQHEKNRPSSSSSSKFSQPHTFSPTRIVSLRRAPNTFLSHLLSSTKRLPKIHDNLGKMQVRKNRGNNKWVEIEKRATHPNSTKPQQRQKTLGWQISSKTWLPPFPSNEALLSQVRAGKTTIRNSFPGWEWVNWQITKDTMENNKTDVLEHAQWVLKNKWKFLNATPTRLLYEMQNWPFPRFFWKLTKKSRPLVASLMDYQLIQQPWKRSQDSETMHTTPTTPLEDRLAADQLIAYDCPWTNQRNWGRWCYQGKCHVTIQFT